MSLVAVDGIPAKRLSEICRAEQEGRLVILPCKVGDTVYWQSRFHQTIQCGNVVSLKLSKFGWDLEVTNGHQVIKREAEKVHYSLESIYQALEKEKTAPKAATFESGSEK